MGFNTVQYDEEGIFGPIYIGALVYALFNIKQNLKVSYKNAIEVGVKNWGRLWLARFMAGIIILLGFIALIILGIIFLVRYILLDFAVIIESADASQARSRSIELTKGNRWKIFGVLLVFLLLFYLISIVVYIPIEFFDHIVLSVVLDCILDVVYGILFIILFLFYWEAREKEPLTADNQIVCQKCGLENWAGYEICQGCGAPLKGRDTKVE